MEMGGGKVSELTPTALYEIFVELCRTKLHIIISYNYQNEEMLKLLRKHKAILNASVHCILKVQSKFHSDSSEERVALIADRCASCQQCFIWTCISAFSKDE